MIGQHSNSKLRRWTQDFSIGEKSEHLGAAYLLAPARASESQMFAKAPAMHNADEIWRPRKMVSTTTPVIACA